MTQNSSSSVPAGDTSLFSSASVSLSNALLGYFVGREGKMVAHGENQWSAYGVRRGRHGTRVVRSQYVLVALHPRFKLSSHSDEMVADTSGVSGAQGKGFDSVQDAQAWCDSFTREKNPDRIAALRAQVDVLVWELAAANARM